MHGTEVMAEVVRDGGIDCDLAFEGALIIAMSQAQLDGLAGLPEAAEALGRGELLRVLSADEAREACGSPRAMGGLAARRAPAACSRPCSCRACAVWPWRPACASSRPVP